MRILLTNDDGVGAEGFAVMRRIAAQLSDDIWTCAPELEQSGAGRGITLSDPLRVRQISERDWAVMGTPTDCVLLAINDLMPQKPDLVLSGVNRGQNVAEDVTFSGTVAGALQGTALGVPSIALSQVMFVFHDSRRAMFETAEEYAPGVLQKLVETGWQAGVTLNLNFPDCAPDKVSAVEVTTQGARELVHMHAERRTDLRGRDYYWMGFKGAKSNPPVGTDLAAIYDGRISITPLHIDLTHRETVHALKGVMGGVPPKLGPPKPRDAKEEA
ncbi:MAG TPA: 5'/3'-nucleotidase SurE [Caulobacteraceae bacterium]|jgi:5'-nucleotidase|nr:5'/3'-nucleotidase SurE [Caulobacteraceae bacterium]